MLNLLRLPSALMLGGLLLLGACGNKTENAENKAGEATEEAGGEQTVARVNGEEITIHQLNTELATVNGAGQDRKLLQEEVLRAIVFRTLLRQAAVKDKLDKSPQVRMLMEGAKDKVLADVYMTSQTGSTPPPTSTQVDQFIADNPLNFNERRIYQFQRLTMATDQYHEDFVPMFDGKDTFDEFQGYLNGKSVPYTLAEVRLPSTDFPKQVQDQLVKFGVGDNVVVRGPQSIVILKIKSWVDMPVEQQDAQRLAQDALHKQAQQARAKSLREQMMNTSKLEFLGEFAGMSLESKQAQPQPPAAPAGEAAPVAPAPEATPAPADGAAQ